MVEKKIKTVTYKINHPRWSDLEQRINGEKYEKFL
jgi:DNA-directed RNA polymerase subunit L